MERSVYIIKPEAVAHRERIRALIQQAGLRVVAHKLMVLPQHALDLLYSGMDDDLHAATLHYFGIGPSEIGIVEGENAISRLNQLVGADVNPMRCAPDTIRGRYGFKNPVKWRTAVYFLNGLHRSKNADEANRDMELFNILTGTVDAQQA
jgi:nucleoside diphosphate kinase